LTRVAPDPATCGVALDLGLGDVHRLVGGVPQDLHVDRGREWLLVGPTSVV
jgi:hypothetical protein